MVEIESFGPVQAFHHGSRFLGVFPPVLTVRCYAVDGLMIDSGLRAKSRQTLQWARSIGVREVILTHHHEDHSGGAAFLRKDGLKVRGSERTEQWVSRGFAVRFYQRIVWGAAQATPVDSLGRTVETDKYRFDVIPAPGHSDDQIVLHEPREGWLFSGDAYLGRKRKYFRRDEDFAATVESVKHLCQLDFDKLFCAHSPVLKNGRGALQRKLQYLLELEGRVREMYAAGNSAKRITREVLGPKSILAYASLGDLSKQNLINSILFGPVLRADAPD